MQLDPKSAFEHLSGLLIEKYKLKPDDIKQVRAVVRCDGYPIQSIFRNNYDIIIIILVTSWSS